MPFNALCSLCAPSTENTNYAVKMESKIVQFYKSEEKIAQKYFQTLRLAFLWIRFNLLFAKQALSHIQYVQEQTVIGQEQCLTPTVINTPIPLATFTAGKLQ